MAAVVDSWHAWAQRLSLPSTTTRKAKKHARAGAERRSEDTLLNPPEEHLVTSSRCSYDANQKNDWGLDPSMPSSRSGVSPSPESPVASNPSSSSSSGNTDAHPTNPPACQLTSPLAPLSQNQPFPSLHPLPTSNTSPMLMIATTTSSFCRSNKLRKSARATATPPTLAPLSFIEEPGLDLDFEHISHNVQSPSLHAPPQHSLTHSPFPQQDAPLPGICEPPPRPSTSSRKLTKRRRPSLPPIPQAQIVSSSSGAAAAAAVTGDPSALAVPPFQVSSPVPSYTPHRAQSDVGHGVRSSLSVKRPNIIRRLSMRTPKRSSAGASIGEGATNSGGGETSFFSGSVSRWSKWRPSASENGHQSLTLKDEGSTFLPLVRVTSPFSISMSHRSMDQDRVPRDSTPQPPSISTDIIPPSQSLVPPYSHADFDPSDLKSLDPTDTRTRPKFTLEANESDIELSNPSSGHATPARLVPYSQSAPPSRTNSAYNPQYLSPFGRSERVYGQPVQRRWTFAMAMTDEEITDEVLIEELERMRLRQTWSGSVDDVEEVWDAEQELFGPSQPPATSPQAETSSQQPYSQNPRQSQFQAEISYTPSLPSFPHQHRNSAPPPGPGSAQHWQTARRALLTCRELVRTERHYLSSLQMLLASETETAPPPLMLRYIEELVKVSRVYLAQMEENPSAWGVSGAFVGVEEAVDSAFVGWCGVVGMWFYQDQPNGEQEGSSIAKGSSTLGNKPSKQTLNDEYRKEKKAREDELSPLKKTVNTWRKSMTSITDASMTITLHNSQKKKERGLSPSSFSLSGNTQRHSGKSRRPPLRDLAILPTQRIMRYVLLYRDLLTHTPSTSPSFPLVKRAADATLRIAQKCDRAQNNSAFIMDKK